MTAATPGQAAEPRACDVDVWDGPYRMNCGLTLVHGKCITHGDSTMRRWRAAQDAEPEPVTAAAGPAPATYGRAFRETLHKRWAARGQRIDTRPWEALPEIDREDLDAAARAAIDAARIGIIRIDRSLSEADAAELREKFAAAARSERPRVLDERDEARALSAHVASLEEDLDDAGETIAGYRDALTAMQRERDEARAVVAEMCAHWERIGTTREEDELIPQWRQRAGLDGS